ncbi:retrotransposon protein [Cucumis melo var. makuwa]|uniref:Retrotransposon protein n=2 Tax=Cucumis melo TaxID=3656 RepID=A0A5D3CX17_CUCMM|nr:retrotransposon protein [Cucumis melo var. makuwa]TYK14749.1 retrotransposon protein [Cucumis melo var. makuwa]
MRGSSCNGFEWNYELKCIIVKKDVFENWSHPVANGLLNRSFPHYNELCYVFGRDCATGGRIETFVDVESNVSGWYEGLASTDDGNNIEIPTMYSQGLDMSPNDIMGTRPKRASGDRNASSELKRKRGGQSVEIAKVICSVMEYVNDQLNQNVDRLIIQCQDASATRQEVVQ